MDTKRKKIMHYYTYPDKSGGPLTYIHAIINSRLSESFEFSICYQNKPLSKIKRKDLRRIITEIEDFKPDILHVHGLQGEGFIGVIVGKKAKVPVILMTVHGMMHNLLANSKLKNAFFKHIIEPYTLKKSDFVYCVSEELESRRIIQKNSKRLLPYLHNFVSDFEPENYISDDIRKKYGLKNTDFIIAIVGRITKDKGMETIEKCIINNKHDDVKFLFLGQGEYKNDLIKNIGEAKSHNVYFAGQVSNVKPFLEISDIYLSASLHENLSIALLEAGNSSLPAVVTNVGDNNKVIFNGYNGYIVEKEDYASMLDRIYYLYKNPILRKQMSNNSRKNIRKNFNEDKFIERLNNIYNLDV